MVHVEDGRIRRVRLLTLSSEDAKGWTIRARNREFTPPRKVTVTALGLQDKDKVYAYDRVLYPLIRRDFVETPDGKNRNTEMRGKTGYRRASWDEALGLIVRETKRNSFRLRKGRRERLHVVASFVGFAGVQALDLQTFFQHAGVYPGARQPGFLGRIPLGGVAYLRPFLAARLPRAV